MSVRAGRAPPQLAPIFSIYDDRQREMLLIGAAGAMAVVRFRTRATVAGLDERELRVPDALRGVQPGTDLQLRFWREAPRYCLEINRVLTCELGFRMGDAWSLLLYPLPRPLALVLPYLWIGVLAALAAFWTRRATERAAVAAVFVLALAVTPRLAGILPTPPAHFAAALAAIGAACVVGQRVRREGVAAAAGSSDNGAFEQ